MEPDKGENGTAAGEEVAKLQKQLEATLAEVKELTTANANVMQKLNEGENIYTDPDFIEFMRQKELDGGGEGSTSGDGTPEKSKGMPDLDKLSGSGLVEFMGKKFEASLAKLAKGMDDNLSKIVDAVELNQARTNLELGKMKDPELAALLSTDEGKQEYLEASKKYSKQSPFEVWKEMKKDRKVAAVEKVEAEEKTAKQEQEDRLKAITEGTGVPPTLADGKEMTDEQIEDIVWNEATGGKKEMD